jgi:hypothetical protein
MATVGTGELSHTGHLDVASFDSQGFAYDQGFCHLAVGLVEDSAKGRSRDIHGRSHLLLVHAFQVGQAQSLQLIEAQDNFLIRRYWRATRPELRVVWQIVDSSATRRSGHRITSLGRIINICS